MNVKHKLLLAFTMISFLIVATPMAMAIHPSETPISVVHAEGKFRLTVEVEPKVDYHPPPGPTGEFWVVKVKAEVLEPCLNSIHIHLGLAGWIENYPDDYIVGKTIYTSSGALPKGDDDDLFGLGGEIHEDEETGELARYYHALITAERLGLEHFAVGEYFCFQMNIERHFGLYEDPEKNIIWAHLDDGSWDEFSGEIIKVTYHLGPGLPVPELPLGTISAIAAAALALVAWPGKPGSSRPRG